MGEPITVVHFIPGLDSLDGGPSRSAVRLTDCLASDETLSVELVFHSILGRSSIQSSNALVRRRTVNSRSRLAVRLGLVDRELLAATFTTERVDLLHTHSVWHLSNYWATRLATKYNVPIICQPRGMLEPWALERRHFKKRLALLLFQQKDLNRVGAFIATSASEAAHLRTIGLRQPVAMIPNGVDLPLPPAGAEGARGNPARERRLLFLSRLHPKKGLINLIQAWGQCAVPGWRLILAGPDEGGHLQDVTRAIARFGVNDSVTYVGELEGDAKATAYASADLFVLPSFSENFALVVPEALSYGVPVIATQATPWRELITDRCGWWIEARVEPLVHALREAVALTDAERAEMGSRGREVAARYKWSTAAQQTADFYRWLLGRGDRPACLIAD